LGGESNFRFNDLANSLTTLEESLERAISLDEMFNLEWLRGLIVSPFLAILQAPARVKKETSDLPA